MPAPTRCPSCSAALAPGASWCSLCHADLRPKLEPVRRSLDVVPGSVASATAVPPVGAVTTAPAPSGGTTSTAVDDAPPPARVRGRHARVEDLDELDELDDVHESSAVAPPEPAPAPAPPRAGSGRHARGRGTASRPRPRSRAAVPFVPPDLEGRELAPEEVDEIADQMLDRLALTETRQRFFDPEDVPGGKVAFMAGLGLAIVVVLVLLYTVLGLILG